MIISLLFSGEILLFLTIFIALVISITVHEFAHVLSARLQGDHTGEQAGRLTLNPLAHLDPMGTIAILLIGFGWGKPAPFNPYNLKNKRFGPALVALAGPFSNFILIIIFGLTLKLLLPYFEVNNYLITFLAMLYTFNGILMIFNLIPVPPLDGSHILAGLLGARFSGFIEKLHIYGPRILMGVILFSLFFRLNIFGYVIQPILNLMTRALDVPIVI